MAIVTLGLVTVTTAGTPVQATATRTPVQSITVQAKSGNTGRIWVGLSTINKGTGAGLLIVLPIPGANQNVPWTFVVYDAPEGLNLADIWFDSDVNGEGVYVHGLQQ